jgi:hypothetical protein
MKHPKLCEGIRYPEYDTLGKCQNEISKRHPFLCDTCNQARIKHISKNFDVLMKEFKKD